MNSDQDEIKGFSHTERSFKEALQMLDESVASNDIQEMKMALALLEEELPVHPEFLPKIEAGNIHLTRATIEGILGESHEVLSANDKLKSILEEVRQRIEVNLKSLRPQSKTEEGGKKAQELDLDFSAPMEDKKTAPEQKEKPVDLETSLNKIMPALLEEADRFNLTNAPSRALLQMLRDGNFGEKELSRWKNFLQKPNAYLPEEASEFTSKSTNELTAMIRGIQNEIEEKKDEIGQLTDTFKSISGNMRSTPEERERIQKAKNDLLKERRGLEAKKSNVEAALQYKKGATRYKSVEQVMCMTQLFLAEEKGEDLPAETDIYKEIERRIDLERGEKEQGMGLLGSSLEATLLILADKNPLLKQVGGPQLKELSQCWDDKVKVELWLKRLTLSDTEKKTVLGALVAYLEMAKNENMITNIKFLSEGHLSKLISHFKGIRHDYAKQRMEKVPAEASNAEKLKAYSEEMALMIHKEEDIHREHLKRTGWEKTRKAGKIAGGAAAIGLAALWATMKFGGKGLKKGAEGFNSLKGENKARVITTGILGSGAAYAGLALTPLAAVALPGLIAPELWKHRKAIAKGTGAVVGETAKFSGRSLAYAAKLSLFPLTMGFSVFSRKWWDSLGKWKVFKGSTSGRAANGGNYNNSQQHAA